MTKIKIVENEFCSYEEQSMVIAHNAFFILLSDFFLIQKLPSSMWTASWNKIINNASVIASRSTTFLK